MAMKKTFVCDESMIVTIPIGSLKNARAGQVLPEKFVCVYKDSYKVFTNKGKPRPLGAAQAFTGVLILILSLSFAQNSHDYAALTRVSSLPSVVYVISGLLSYAAGHFPNMHLVKLSFSLNIISLFWSIVALCILSILYHDRLHVGEITGLIIGLLVVEKLIALFLIYWLSKAVCRQHFNTLPTILLKQGD